MATSTYSVPLSDFFGESPALATSLALAGLINTKNGFRGLDLYCASDWKLLLTPKIHYVIFYDNSATSYTNFTANALDRDDSTDVTLGAMTASDYLYILTPEVIGGIGINMDASSVNAVTTTLDMEYYKSGTPNTWADVSTDSDGTDSSGNETGATLGQDGVYTWTAPTDAVELIKTDAVNGIWGFYSIRFSPGATLTAGTAINGLVSVHKGTNYVTYQAGNTEVLTYDNDFVGGLQFISVAGTPALKVGFIRYKG